MDHHSDTRSTDRQDSEFSITAQNLSKRFNREWIFRDLNRQFANPHWYAITGPNGSGKSTLLQVLWGQLPPSAGLVVYKRGSAVLSHDELIRHISIAAPYMELIGELTLMEHLRFHFRMKKPRNKMSLSDLVDILYLNEATDKYINNFSSGMKQRLKLGLAMYSESDVVFLDEPGTNLDNQAFDWYSREIQKLRGKCLMVIASNNPREYPGDTEIIDLVNLKKSPD